MAHTCIHCGEELLGNVNRCWRCGQPVLAGTEPAELPPVRGQAIPLQQVQQAESRPPVEAETAAEPPAAADPGDVPADRPPRRVGSPFDASVPPRRLVAGERAERPPATQARNPAAAAGAAASLVLGSFSVAASLLTPMAAVPALLGIPLGLWGLASNRRRMALAGILLCSAGIACSGIHAVFAFRQLSIR